MRSKKYQDFFLENLSEFSSIKQLVKSKIKKARLNLRNSNLRVLPNTIKDLVDCEYLEIDLSDNYRLDIEKALESLSIVPNLKYLDLSNNRIEKIPANIGKLQSLEGLALYNCKIAEIPLSFGNLSLKYLNLRSNQLKDLRSIFKIATLKELNLRSTNFSKPNFEEIARLSNLEKLDLRRTFLRRLPDIFTNLAKLTHLNLEGNNLQELPESIGKLSNLSFITLRKNLKFDWDKGFELLARLPKLQTLDLSEHKFKVLSPKISLMQQITYLNLSNNKLEDLPEGLRELKNLEKIHFVQNPQLNYAKLFKLISALPLLKKIYLGDYRHDSLPKEIAFLTQIEELEISFSDIKELPEELGKMQSLKKFKLKYCENIKKLNENIGELQNLESLELHIENLSFKNLPTSFVNLQSLSYLDIHQTAIKKLPEGFAKLQNLKTLYLNNFKEIPEEICEIACLEKLYFMGNALRKLPKKISQLQNLRELDYSTCNKLDLEDTFEKVADLQKVSKLALHFENIDKLPKNLTKLKYIKILDLDKNEKLNLSDTFDMVAQMPQVEELVCSQNKFVIPQKLTKLIHLKKITLNFNGNYGEMPGIEARVPLELALFENTIFKSNYVEVFKGTNLFIERYSKLNLSQDKRIFLFSLITGNYDKLLEMYENPLSQENFEAAKSVFFITGRINGFTQSTLKEKLKEYNIRCATKLHQKVNYVLIGRLTKTEVLEQIIQNDNFQIVLEDQLKAYIWQQDKPYLMDESSEEMNESILDLLMSEDSDNLGLAFQMLEGGGANKYIVSYLAVLHLFHPEANIRKDARVLFRKYASADLQGHLRKNWRDSFRNVYQSPSSFKALYNHPELDAGNFLVMLVRVRWDFPVSYYSNRIKTQLDWTNISLEALPDSLKYLSSIEQVNLSDNPQLNWEESLKVLKTLPNLTKLILNKCKLKNLPKTIFELDKLKQLTLIRNEIVDIPTEIQNLKNLEILWLDENKLHRIPESLGKLPKLHTISLSNCELIEIDVLAQIKSLEEIHVSNNKITDIGEGFSHLTNLANLYLNNNQIKSLASDFGNMPKVKRLLLNNNQIEYLPQDLNWQGLFRLEIFNNQLKELPASIEKCQELNTISLQSNLLKSIPTTIKNLRKLNSINLEQNLLAQIPSFLVEAQALSHLHLSKNKIRELPTFISKFSNLSYCNLSHNQIEKIPEKLEDFKELHTLDLSYNQIEELPKNLPVPFDIESKKRVTLNLQKNPIQKSKILEYQSKFRGIYF